MKSIRRGRERVRDRERPGPSENQARWSEEFAQSAEMHYYNLMHPEF